MKELQKLMKYNLKKYNYLKLLFNYYNIPFVLNK